MILRTPAEEGPNAACVDVVWVTLRGAYPETWVVLETLVSSVEEVQQSEGVGAEKKTF